MSFILGWAFGLFPPLDIVGTVVLLWTFMYNISTWLSLLRAEWLCSWCDDIRRQGLWEVTRFRLGCERGAHFTELVPLEWEEGPQSSLSALCGHGESAAIRKPGGKSLPEPGQAGTLISEFRLLELCEIRFHFWRPPHLWYFVRGALRGFPGGSDGKASACNVRDPGSIPGSVISPGEGNGNPLQDSCLENPMDRGAWRATVRVVAKSQTWLSN